MPKGWARILELRFLCEPEARLTLTRIGKLLGISESQVHDDAQRAIAAAGTYLDPAIRRLRDIQAIFWEADRGWRLWGTRRCKKPELFEERLDQNLLREREQTAPQAVDCALDDRENSLKRPDQDDAAYRQLKNRTGDPDWQPKPKSVTRHQQIGCRYPLGMKHQAVAHLGAIVDCAVANGHPIRAWRMKGRHDVELPLPSWGERHWRFPAVTAPPTFVNRVAVIVEMRGADEKKLAA
jgi:hypothetical protein